jgi:hypothetical protein
MCVYRCVCYVTRDPRPAHLCGLKAPFRCGKDITGSPRFGSVLSSKDRSCKSTHSYTTQQNSGVSLFLLPHTLQRIVILVLYPCSPRSVPGLLALTQVCDSWSLMLGLAGENSWIPGRFTRVSSVTHTMGIIKSIY